MLPAARNTPGRYPRTQWTRNAVMPPQPSKRSAPDPETSKGFELTSLLDAPPETAFTLEQWQALIKAIDMSKVQEEAASKPFVESKISDIRADIAERFGELKAILADVKADNADVKAAHAEQSSKMLRTIITALIFMTGLLGLFIRFLPQPAPPAYPPVIVQTPPVPAVAETPPADPPAPLPVDAE